MGLGGWVRLLVGWLVWSVRPSVVGILLDKDVITKLYVPPYTWTSQSESCVLGLRLTMVRYRPCNGWKHVMSCLVFVDVGSADVDCQ